MSFTKFATFEVSEILDIKGSADSKRTASLDKVSDWHDYRTDDGYIYARIRAISSRVNKNHDGWPSVELAGGPDVWETYASTHQAGTGFTMEAGQHRFGFSTFVGKPFFVDHNNTDPKRARGVIRDSKLHVEDHKTAASLDPYYADAPEDHLPPTWVELLIEVDAKSYPKLAKEIVEGAKNPHDGIDGFSMGCDVERSRCNICSNVATSPDEYCEHIRLKGAHFNYTDPKTGHRTSKRSYEDCYGIGFFEISAVFDPADETALIRELINEQPQHAAKTAENDLPQDMMIKAPENVDTLREEKVCPVCGNDQDGEQCDVCGYVSPPKGLDNPDLTKALNHDQEQQDVGQDSPPVFDRQDNIQDKSPGGPPAANETAVSYLQARKPGVTSSVTSEMSKWTASHPKLAAGERPIQPSPQPATNEPTDESIQSDQDQPVISAKTPVRLTAERLIAATRNNQRNTMSDSNRVAAEPVDSAGSADKRVNVTDTGGVADASNEQASKADKQVEVVGEGGVIEDSNEAATQAESQSVEGTSDNAGFNTDKNIEGTPTKTFDNSNEPDSAVTSEQPEWQTDGKWSATHVAYDEKPFPSEDGGLSGGNAKGGAEPADSVGKPGERVDLLQPASSPANNSGKTDTWSGTGGNGVTKQQEPVTTEDNPFIDSKPKSSAHLFTAFKLADTEVELGLIRGDQKYDRVAELETEEIGSIQARLDTLSRVKTAGLSKQATPQVGRVPSLQRSATTHVAQDIPTVTEDVMDSALFS